MTVCSYHVTHGFQNEYTLCSCLNVKELLALNRRDIWSLSDCYGTWTHNQLIRKRTLNHLAKLAKWLSCVVSTYLYGAFVYMFLSCHVREFCCSHLNFRYCACFEQRVPWHSGSYRMWVDSETRTWHDKNIQSNPLYRKVLTTQLNHLASGWGFVFRCSQLNFKLSQNFIKKTSFNLGLTL